MGSGFTYGTPPKKTGASWRDGGSQTAPVKQSTAPAPQQAAPKPAPTTGGNSQGPDIAALIAAMQQNQQPQQPSAPLVNSSTTNPTVDGTVLPALIKRAEGGMGADTAIRLAHGATRDALSGTLKELEGGAARRGVGGTGAEGIQKGRAATKAQQQMAGQSAQIAYGAEQDRNNLYKDIAGIAQGSDSMQNEQRRLGLSQWQAQQSVGLQQQQINNAKDDRLFSLITKALF